MKTEVVATRILHVSNITITRRQNALTLFKAYAEKANAMPPPMASDGAKMPPGTGARARSRFGCNSHGHRQPQAAPSSLFTHEGVATARTLTGCVRSTPLGLTDERG